MTHTIWFACNDEFLDPVKASQGQDGQNNAAGGGDWYMGYCVRTWIRDS